MSIEVTKSIWRRINKPSRDTVEKLHDSILQGIKAERAARGPDKQFNDYEPEQAWGTHHDFNEWRRHGGSREDY